MYGQRTLPQSASYELLSNMVATQIIVWEIAIGWRNATPPYAQTNDAFIRRFENAYGKGPEATSMYISIGGRLKNVISAYNQISANMAAHSDAIPSFTSAAQNAAPTIDLKPNGNGQYSAVVTDSNRVISGYSFPRVDGLTFSTNGNVLTITSDRPLDNVLVAPTRNRVNTQGHPFFVWYNGSYQVMLGSQADPSYEDLPVYFRVRAVNPTGSLKLVKTTEDGKNLSGWKFGIYSDSGCTNLVSGPQTTDSTGALSVSNLTAGTVYVKELGHTDASVAALYTCDSANPQKVTITAGATATVNFHNRLNTGGVKLVKETNTGKNLDGWQIGLYTDAACTKPVSGSPFTTGADGSVTVSDLSVGTLYAKEIEVDDPYWVCDTSVKTVNITAGQTATVSFCNMQYGKIQIQKAMETVGSLTGWQFRITDSSDTEIPGSPFTTDETGLILTGKIQPGEYKVEELIPENSLYSCTSENPQTVTVKAGETAGVSFTNALRPGRILIEKVDIRGEPLADAKFLLEWSKDGSLWWPVEYTDAETVREGFCFNAKCVNGTLTSGKDGLLEWTGLHPGLMYRVTELEAPKGYSLLTEPAFEGILPADNLTVSFRVVNCEIFKLPETGVTSITSESTYLSCYTFVDTLSKGLSYNKGDVVLEFFTDAACMDSVAKWTEADGKFTVAYNTTDTGDPVMTIEMTAAGLTEINTSKAVYSGASMVNSGYSDCTVRITYAAKMDSSSDLVFGDKGNDNKVVLTWKRSSQNYYDTLVDDCHVFTYGIDLTKLFSDGKGDFSKVEFLIQNKTDNYFVKAELNKDEGVYYVVDHVTDKAEATHFVPVKTADSKGKIVVKGLEDDAYTLTEVRTDSGYVLLKQGIDVVISQKNTDASCAIYGTDVLGLIQNDPRYASIIKDNGDLHNMPQKHLEHKLLTASANVDGKKVNIVEDNGSINAEAPLTVVNTSGFDLPQTGDHGTWMFTVGGIVLMASAMVMIFIVCRKKSDR